MESYAHGKDAGSNTTVVRNLIAENGTCRCIHDQPDVSFETTELYVSFVGSEDTIFLVRILVNKWLDTDCSGLA